MPAFFYFFVPILQPHLSTRKFYVLKSQHITDIGGIIRSRFIGIFAKISAYYRWVESKTGRHDIASFNYTLARITESEKLELNGEPSTLSQPRRFISVIGLISRPNTSIATPRECRCKGQSPPDKTTELPRSQSMNDNNKAYLYDFRWLFLG